MTSAGNRTPGTPTYARFASARFASALHAGDLEFVRRHARAFAQVRLEDALRICLLIRDQDPERYEQAAVRWLGRFALEAKMASLGDLREAADALDLLTRDAETAMEQLAGLCVRHRLAG